MSILQRLHKEDSLTCLRHVNYPPRGQAPEIAVGGFEKNIQRIIETYKNSNDLTVKSTSAPYLQKLYVSFNRLFNERRKSETAEGWLTQYFPPTRLAHQSDSGSTNLKYCTHWKGQISKIKSWFQQKLEKPISEVISAIPKN
ncbi:MAG: hypothetical protein HYY52_00805 [Candidatus Melainabacteria bacterium]|nr:hypothetical protein [Candidatus Melainabacteria bacterium]